MATFSGLLGGSQRAIQVRIDVAGAHAYVFIGDAASFEDAEGAAAELSTLTGRVAWIDWIESRRAGGGTELMRRILDSLRDDGVHTVALQVVPPNAGEDDPRIERLVRFYARFGFHKSTLAPWSDFPVMTLNLES